MHRRRHRLAGLLLAVGLLLAGLTAPADAATTGFRLLTPSPTVQVFGGDGFVFAEVPVYMAAYGQGLEVTVRRSGYDRPIRATQTIIQGRRRTTTPLPATQIDGFAGYADGIRITVRDLAGNVVLEQSGPWCPNGFNRQRVDPTGPANPVYPSICSSFPFTLATVWGIEQGWASSVTPFLFFEGTDDAYDATIAVSDALGDRLGLPADQRSGQVRLLVEQFTGPGAAERAATAAGIEDPVVSEPGAAITLDAAGVRRPAAATGTTAGPASPGAVGPAVSTTARTRPPTTSRRPARATLPDLVSLPAFGISVTAEDNGRDLLNFFANEWNAGPAPMVVEGFRRPGPELIMDAYQSFYRNGQVVLTLPTGTMEFHDDPDHMHWHFLDFAKYEMVDSAGTVVTTSGKQSWCLAPTDPIDLTIKGAVYRPESTGLGSSCGGPEALWLRETLPVGWGDTYAQFQTQAMDVTDLPNGTYRVKITVNPDGRLYEASTANNVSYREVILGGTPGARTVTVPPYLGLDTETGFNGPF